MDTCPMDIEQMVYNSPERPSTLGDVELRRDVTMDTLASEEAEPDTVPETAVVAPAATDASVGDVKAPAAIRRFCG